MASKIIKCPVCNKEYGIEEHVGRSFECTDCASVMSGILICAIGETKASREQRIALLQPSVKAILQPPLITLICPGCGKQYSVKATTRYFPCKGCGKRVSNTSKALQVVAANSTRPRASISLIQQPIVIEPQRTIITLTCSGCKRAYRVYEEAHTDFSCFDCQTRIMHSPGGSARPIAAPIPPSSGTPIPNPAPVRGTIPYQRTSGTDYSDILGFLIAVVIMGFIIWSIWFSDKSNSTAASSQPQASSYQPQAQPTRDTAKVYVVPPPETIAQMQHTQAVSDRSNHSLSRLIDSSGVTFDENFRPIAAVRLHNTMGKEIDEVILRFTFTTTDEEDGSISTIAANEYSSYYEVTGALKPDDSNTWKILIPPTQRKNFDTPTISVVKVRYFDGSISTDGR